MADFNEEEFLGAFAAAKLMAYRTKSRDPKREALLAQLRDKTDEIMDLAEKIVTLDLTAETEESDADEQGA